MKKIKHVMLCFILYSLAIFPVSAGIIAAGTRMIYLEGENERSLMLANTNRYPVIVQSWIDDGSGNPDYKGAPFVVLPPVFRLEPGEIKGIRIIYNQQPLPDDRESVA
ncbi:MAG: putative fimbrial chaperone LpfB [Candidatus Erwinia impunctatus]|nr:putative fimbrial chaperone LpfB [Culicoides impunctatus]